MKSLNENIVALVTECDSRNPLCGVKPDLNVFGSGAGAKIDLLLAGIWAIVLAVIAAGFLMGLGKWGWAKNRSHDPDDLASGADRMKKSGLAFGVAVMAGTVLTAVIRLAG